MDDNLKAGRMSSSFHRLAHDGQNEFKRSRTTITFEDDTPIQLIGRHLKGKNCDKAPYPLTITDKIPLHFTTNDDKPGIAVLYCGFCDKALGEVKLKTGDVKEK